jgi:hypothetical protein
MIGLTTTMEREMNHQDKRILVQKYGMNQTEVKKVFSMVRSGAYTMERAAQLVLKERTK